MKLWNFVNVGFFSFFRSYVLSSELTKSPFVNLYSWFLPSLQHPFTPPSSSLLLIFCNFHIAFGHFSVQVLTNINQCEKHRETNYPLNHLQNPSSQFYLWHHLKRQWSSSAQTSKLTEGKCHCFTKEVGVYMLRRDITMYSWATQKRTLMGEFLIWQRN